jgi:signal transduction histidine kinase
LAIENAQLRDDAEEMAVIGERHRLARELHDAVTQTLFSASLIADVLPRIWERDPEMGTAKLEELRELTRGALAEMRTLLLELRPATLTESSLAELLRQLAAAVIGRSRLQVDVVVEGERPLPPETQVALYRIAQEALNNIVKHAGATQVTINLRFLPDCVEMVVVDNGRGFDATAVSIHSLGLGIMRERAAKINANLQVESVIGEGTTIRVQVCK